MAHLTRCINTIEPCHGHAPEYGLVSAASNPAIWLVSGRIHLSDRATKCCLGLKSPFVGALADRIGLRPVMVAGALLYALGLVLMHQFPSALGLLWGPGVVIGLALSCTASVLSMSAASRAVPASQRSLALGIVSAFGSIGTLLAAPLAQWLLELEGLSFALMGFGVLCMLMIPAAWQASKADEMMLDKQAAGEAQNMRQALHEAL